MRISFDSTNSRFIAEFAAASWNADKDLAKRAGFRCLGPDAGWLWCTQDAGLVLRLKGTPGLTVSKEAHEKLAEAEIKLNSAIQASRADDANIDIPCPEGLSYLGYQKAGILFALRVFGDVI